MTTIIEAIKIDDNHIETNTSLPENETEIIIKLVEGYGIKQDNKKSWLHELKNIRDKVKIKGKPVSEIVLEDRGDRI
jgi:hypothetical protein